MTEASGGGGRWRRVAGLALGAVAVAVALDLRAAGSFRGLHDGYVFHPDAPKQVRALGQYLTGRYLWYTGSWFYDGYPYGLNHVDEWILRGTIPLGRLVQRWLVPDVDDAQMLDRAVLYYWVHGLRILYGMIVFGTTVAVAVLLTRRRACVGLTAGLAALAPLSAVVTHSATGDIGVDLFTMFAVLLLAWHTRHPRPVLLWGAGVMVGMAFSCKYNGALVGIPIALYVAALAWQRRRWSLLVGGGLLAVVGLSVGILIGTPALWISWRQTWIDMGENFEKIRWYCVHESWRERPLLERLVDSVRTNGLRIGTALGWPLLTGAVASSALWLRRGAWPRTAAGPTPDARAAAQLAIALYPLLALGISVLGKPVVQPFHFSYLVPPLILATVFLFDRLPVGARVGPRLTVTAILLLALLDSAARARSERFFWVRDDIKAYQNYERVVLAASASPERSRGEVIRAFCLEPANMAEFRNLPGKVRAANPVGRVWRGLEATPLPTIPFPRDHDWIMLNGPTFPRDDRTFRLMPGMAKEKQSVAFDAVPVLYIGIRSGMWPARVRLDVGGERRLVELGVDDERVVEIAAADWRVGEGREDIPTVRMCRVSAHTELGDAWVTVMRSAAERDAYALTGPSAAWTNLQSQTWPEPTADVLSALASARFYDSEGTPALRLDASDGRQRERFLLVAEDESLPGAEEYPRIADVVAYHDMPVLRSRSWGTLALPAGAYRWECEWGALDNGAEVSMQVVDALGVHVGPLARATSTLALGRQRVELPFVKPYAPYECRLVVTCTAGKAELLQWRLVPDVERMLVALRDWSAGGAPPAWGPAENRSRLMRVQTDASFGGRVRLLAVSYPPVYTVGETLEMDMEVVLMRHDICDYGDLDLFVHFYEVSGREAYAERYPLDSLVSAVRRGESMRMPIDSRLAPGLYELRLAIRNRYTRRRLDVDEAREDGLAVHGRKLVIGRMDVRAAAHDDARAKK